MGIKPVEIQINAIDETKKGFDSASKRLDDLASKLEGGLKGEALSAGEALRALGDQLQTVQRVAIAALGGGFAGQLIADLNETAEAFATVSDRVKLAVGDTGSFDQALEGVQEVALATNSELQATGDLFAKLNQVGQQLGRTQEQALALTQSINQAVQLSGGSAESARAAITQLVQGLNGGVLRGDEFNSVMEQSPRLAKALADGLGKTTGELRKLAEQGALTSEVVIGALEGQAQTLNNEFEKLSGKPSQALQNLSTAWTVYVGNADKATGASKAAADAINLLAKNLDTIVGLLLDAGQAVSAFVALRLAQHFLSVGTAAKTAAVSLTASTAAMNAASASAAAAGANVGRMATILGGLKTLSLLGVVTNIQDIGTWLGESAAKLAGYKDMTEELAREERIAAEISAENARQKAALAQATQLAMEAARGLTPEARALVTEFDKMREAGKGAGDALADLSKKANLQDATGIETFMVALRDLAVQGKASGDQIREALAGALKGEDLARFEVMAKTALSGARNEAELLNLALDASLREAIRRSGADFATISGGMSQAATQAVNDTDLIIRNLDRLSDQGVDTAAALTASLGKGIKTADSQAALQAVRQQIEGLRNVLGDRVTNGLLQQLEEQTERVKSKVSDVESAFKRLGIRTKEELQKSADETKSAYETILNSGQATADGLQRAFMRYAQAAIEANGGVVSESLKVEAAMRGLQIQTDSTGNTIIRSMRDASDATRDAARSADAASGAYTRMADAAEAVARINEKYSRPEGGSVIGGTREERLAGQNAVDNSLIFQLRDKLDAGLLGAEDATALRAAIEAIRQNQAVDRSIDRMNPGAFSLAGMADRNEWAAVLERFEQALSRVSGGVSGAASFGTGPTRRSSSVRTVELNLKVNGQDNRAEMSEDAAETVIRSLEEASKRAVR